ncbi:hypothetical protein Tsubulata_007506 [Turnera subulata]|uniref:DUF4283 domain-containing protein n=1 Tax=Turnera subulata TaxID=218843 RepID=A0A9Q0JFY1_9ROSI|nr:hypothetical protein Tsubulata_007506 [Turnera subulata]
MASCDVLPSSSVLDPSGVPRERSAMVMDLDRLDQLLKVNSNVQRKLKGKNVADSVISSLPVNPIESQPDCVAINPTRPRVPPAKSIELGVSAPTVNSPSSHSGVAPKSQSWANVAKGSIHPLSFVQPIFDASSMIMQIPSELLEIGRQKFSLCLVGQFMGKSPKMGLIQAMAARLWGRDGSISVVSYKEGLYLFQFPSDSSMTRALQGGPWHIGGIPLLLRKWAIDIEPVDFSTSIIPVWVQLKSVPIELLTKEGLSYLTSAIGNPLHMNQDYSKLLYSDRVNVCVGVDFSKPLLEELTITFDGCTHTIDISYSWKPAHCDHCNNWGHHQLACPATRPSSQWVPKVNKIAASLSVTAVHPPVESFPPPLDSAPAVSSSSAVTISTCDTAAILSPKPVLPVPDLKNYSNASMHITKAAHAVPDPLQTDCATLDCESSAEFPLLSSAVPTTTYESIALSFLKVAILTSAS